MPGARARPLQPSRRIGRRTLALTLTLTLNLTLTLALALALALTLMPNT